MSVVTDVRNRDSYASIVTNVQVPLPVKTPRTRYNSGRKGLCDEIKTRPKGTNSPEGGRRESRIKNRNG